MIVVTIAYTDGRSVEIHPKQWASVRADGVDEILVRNDRGTVSLAGHSVYWCRAIDDRTFAFGSASFYQNNRPPEVVFTDTTQEARPLHPDYVPDLAHGDIKLGAWRNGTRGDKYEGESWRAFTT